MQMMKTHSKIQIIKGINQNACLIAFPPGNLRLDTDFFSVMFLILQDRGIGLLVKLLA